MSPFDFLNEEFENVSRALKETLRHDFVPERSKQYYDECVARLAEIARAISVVSSTNSSKIAEIVNELSFLAKWISLIERSHLGEFSWPFAEQLNRLAKTILAEVNMAGDRLEPITHVVAEGHGYRIEYETQVPAASGRRRFVIVAFPRSLKHHVLLHAIFGHELCHTAIYAATAGRVIQGSVVPILTQSGPMTDEDTINEWLYEPAAPQELRDELSANSARYGMRFRLDDYYRLKWLIELMCDLFGLLLFGPAFLAAHCALLRPTHPQPYVVDLTDPTHPPYAVRQKMLVQAMHLTGWNIPVTTPDHGSAHEAEKELLAYILDDPHDAWATVFTDAQLNAVISAVRQYFDSLPYTGYRRAKPENLVTMANLINEGVPPVIDAIDADGQPSLDEVDITQMLYAGWISWIGRHKFTSTFQKDFLVTNRLCDLALLQQQAISLAIPAGEREWRSWGAVK